MRAKPTTHPTKKLILVAALSLLAPAMAQADPPGYDFMMFPERMALVVDASGKLLAPRQRLDTPYPCPPSVMLGALAELAAPLPPHNRIAIGFPGVLGELSARGGNVRNVHRTGAPGQ